MARNLLKELLEDKDRYRRFAARAIDERRRLRRFRTGLPTTTSSEEAETATLATQMDTDGTAPDSTRRGHINTLIKALKDAGIWTKCDRIYVLAAHESTAARIDWKTPGTDTLAVGAAPGFVADQG